MHMSLRANSTNTEAHDHRNAITLRGLQHFRLRIGSWNLKSQRYILGIMIYYIDLCDNATDAAHLAHGCHIEHGSIGLGLLLCNKQRMLCTSAFTCVYEAM